MEVKMSLTKKDKEDWEKGKKDWLKACEKKGYGKKIEPIKAKVDKNRFCILNIDSWNPFSINPKLLGKPNTKSAQEVQQEQCRGKTIVEVLNAEFKVRRKK